MVYGFKNHSYLPPPQKKHRPYWLLNCNFWHKLFSGSFFKYPIIPRLHTCDIRQSQRIHRIPNTLLWFQVWQALQGIFIPLCLIVIVSWSPMVQIQFLESSTACRAWVAAISRISQSILWLCPIHIRLVFFTCKALVVLLQLSLIFNHVISYPVLTGSNVHLTGLLLKETFITKLEEELCHIIFMLCPFFRVFWGFVLYSAFPKFFIDKTCSLPGKAQIVQLPR